MTARSEEQTSIRIPERFIVHIHSNCIGKGFLLTEMKNEFCTRFIFIMILYLSNQFHEAIFMFRRHCQVHLYRMVFPPAILSTLNQVFF